jgi:hypothetical protein
MVTSCRRSAAFVAARALVALAFAFLAVAPARAQIAGDNVNMVTGTEWPGGDPFLQRQNEPSIAVSSANPQHLFAGANDYRSVDVPFPLDMTKGQKMAGDAWAGVFKSLDGGQTWKSTLLPGYPQDTSPLGARSPVRACPAPFAPGTDPAQATQACNAFADPVTRAGTDGLIYYGGIVFKRGTSFGQVVVSRFIDLNNKENGDAVTNSDPMKFVDTVSVARSAVVAGADDAAEFLDKPWMAVDVPRGGAQTCTIRVPDPADPTKTLATRSFPGGAVYVAYVVFPPGEATSNVMVKRSLDCGATWSAPVKVNDDSSKLNQGPTLAIDPTTGKLYVSWRRVAWPQPTGPCGTPDTAACPAIQQPDAIMVSRSFSQGAQFTRPRVVASGFYPFDLFTTPSGFRATAMPSMAISVGPEGNKRRVHVAWSQRDANGDGRVMLATASVGVGPASGAEKDETDATAEVWPAARPVDPDELGGRTGNFTRGHQFLPQLTFSQGRLMVVYYDSHYDHARSFYRPHEFNPLTGSFFDEIKAPIAGPAPFGSQLDQEPWDPTTGTGIYAPWLDDGTTRYVRHTLDARVGATTPSDAPDFVTSELTKYRFGVRGDELATASGGSLTVPGYDGGIDLVRDGKLRYLQQLELNPPNLPLFKNGTVPFIGDYIDVQGPAFVRGKNGWDFNTAFQSAPVFHAVWTSNQRVRPPRPDADGNVDWTKYTPVVLGTKTFDGDAAQVACSSGNEGSRNQDIYTSRISFGLEVSSPQNAKMLDATYVRSFVAVARNATSQEMPVRFSVASPGQVLASFRNDLASKLLTSQDAVVPPHSAIHRTVFVLLRSGSASPTSSLSVSVSQLAASGGCTIDAGNCPLLAGGASATLALNPPGATFQLLPPDGATDNATGESYAIALDGASLTDSNWQNSNWQNSNWQNVSLTNSEVNSNWQNSNWQNSNWQNSNWQNSNWQNSNYWSFDLSNWQNSNWQNSNWQNSNWQNATFVNSNWQNSNWQNASVGEGPVQTGPVSDLNYLLKNTGSTSTAYDVWVVSGESVSVPLQAMATKSYATAEAQGCERRVERRSVAVAGTGELQSSLANPNDQVPSDPNAAHMTFALAPGESAQVTLRAPLSLADMAALGAKLSVVAVPQGIATAPGAPVTFLGSRQSTTTSLVAPSGAMVTAWVWPNREGTTDQPTGVVTFLVTRANGVIVPLGNAPLANGQAQMALPALQAGDTLTAYYGGDKHFTGSSALLNGTTTAITASPSARVAPTDDVTFTADVSAAAVAGSPVGDVSFIIDSTSAFGRPLTSTAELQYTTKLPLGTHRVQAAFAAGQGFVGGSASLYVEVGYATAASLAVAPSPSVAGQPATATVYVNRVGANGNLIFPPVDLVGQQICSACHAAHNAGGGGSPYALNTNVTALVAANGPLFAQGSVELYEVPAGGGDPTFLSSVALNSHARASISLPTTLATGAHTLLARFVPATSSGFFGSEATAAQTVLPALTVFGRDLGYSNEEILVSIDSTAVNDATVTVNGTPLPNMQPWGYYFAALSPAVAPGSALSVSVAARGSTASANAIVPWAPTIVAPTNGAVLAVTQPITVTWALPPGAALPDRFLVLADWASGAGRDGITFDAGGTATNFTIPANSLPAGQQILLRVWSYNDVVPTGQVASGSVLNVRGQSASGAVTVN